MQTETEDSARLPDTNNWFEIKNNPLSKVGVFDYSGASIGAPDKNKIYKVYRPAEELGHPECLNSFKLVPFINDHTMLGDEESGLTPAERKGVHGVIGEDVKFEDGILKGNLKVFSSRLAKIIADGKKELSLGYRCLYDFVEGVYDGKHYDAIQRNIRGNHLALVDQGRMGKDVAVLDCLDHINITIDSKEITKMELEQLVKQQGDAIAKLTASLDEAIKEIAAVKADKECDEEEKAAADKKAADMEAMKKEEEEKKEGMDAKLKTAMDKIEAFEKEGVKALMSQISQRDALAKNLSNHIGSFDHADKTLAEVAKYGVEKLAIKCEDGQEIAVLNGFLHNRPNPSSSVVSMDSKAKNDSLDAYLSKSTV